MKILKYFIKWHESDDAVPREFIEAAYILSEDQRPNAMVLQHKVRLKAFKQTFKL